MGNKHLGSNFDDFLTEEAFLEGATATAMRRVTAWQIDQEMKAQITFLDRHGYFEALGKNSPLHRT